MAEINVYEQYFKAEGEYNGVERRGALVMLISDSCEGNIKYDIAVTFFPHRDDEDYAVSYDAYFSKTVYEAKGRRSKKKEAGFLETFREDLDELLKDEKLCVLWDEELRPARFG